MKKIALTSKVFLLAFTFLLSYGTTATAQQSQQSVVLAPEDFEKVLKPSVQLIDVRTPDEYKAGRIGEAKNINFYDPDFKVQMEKLDKNKPVAIYCGVGGRSGKASAILNQLGFKKIYDLKGGITAWKASGKKLKQ